MAAQTEDGWLTACKSAHCVQVKFTEQDTVMIRATEKSGMLWFTQQEWNTFVDGVKRGEFDQ